MRRIAAGLGFSVFGWWLLFGGVTSGLAEVAADAFLNDFRISGDYVLIVGGKRSEQAELYYSERARTYLVMAPELPMPILVSPAAQDVQGVDRSKLLVRTDGTVDVAADAELRAVGTFRLEGNAIHFLAGTRACRLEPRPWLLGPQTGAALIASNPEYGRRSREFQPNSQALAKLKEYRGEPVRVLTFFGSWCPFCKKHVPFLLRVEREIVGPSIRFDYYGLPEAFSGDPEARRFGIRGVPTAIVFRGEKEIGRLAASEWQSPESALAKLILGSAP